VTASGWETIEACDAGISTIDAFARSAIYRCVAGGIALSSVPSRYHDGIDRQATGPDGAPNAVWVNGRCATAMTWAISASTSPAKAARNFSWSPRWQLFAVGYAACFESALGAAGRRRRQEIGDVAIDATVMLLPTQDRRYELAVALAVTLPSVDDPAEAVELVREADRLCPYSNATRGNVDVSHTVNGRDVERTSAPVVA
jgi:Ohr subfamily peroxiredoxin